jgi:hypothetical protein
MSRNGSGTYTLPAGNPVVTGTTISSTWANSTLTNIASALTDSLAADGQTTATGNLKMGNNRITGLADGIAATDAASITQVTSAVAITGGTINGTSVGATTAATGRCTTLEATGVTTVQAGTVSAPAITTTGDTNTGIFFPAADTIAFSEGGAEVARFDASGNLLVGTTTASGNRLDVVGGGVAITASGTSFNLLNITDSVDQSGATYIQFSNSAGGNIGNINRVTTTNAVVYNTTSDYRLKNVIGDVTGQGSRIDALKPIDYQWKEGNEQARGFLAHEFQTVYPNSVSGEKDALEKDGSPKYQSMQASSSEVMADLIAEIQSLRKRIAALEA